jgi:uncharacterized protein (TIGR03437 family)
VKTSGAAPDETIILYGTGFGPTTTAAPAGKLLSADAALSGTVTVTIGGAPATVPYQGRTGSGLDQLNVIVPAGLPNGDAAIVASIGGASTQPNQFLTIQH